MLGTPVKLPLSLLHAHDADLVGGTTPVHTITYDQHLTTLKTASKEAGLAANDGVFVAGIDTSRPGPAMPMNLLGVSHEWSHFEDYLKGMSGYAVHTHGMLSCAFPEFPLLMHMCYGP